MARIALFGPQVSAPGVPSVRTEAVSPFGLASFGSGLSRTADAVQALRDDMENKQNKIDFDTLDTEARTRLAKLQDDLMTYPDAAKATEVYEAESKKVMDEVIAKGRSPEVKNDLARSLGIFNIDRTATLRREMAGRLERDTKMQRDARISALIREGASGASPNSYNLALVGIGDALDSDTTIGPQERVNLYQRALGELDEQRAMALANSGNIRAAQQMVNESEWLMPDAQARITGHLRSLQSYNITMAERAEREAERAKRDEYEGNLSDALARVYAGETLTGQDLAEMQRADKLDASGLVTLHSAISQEDNVVDDPEEYARVARAVDEFGDAATDTVVNSSLSIPSKRALINDIRQQKANRADPRYREIQRNRDLIRNFVYSQPTSRYLPWEAETEFQRMADDFDNELRADPEANPTEVRKKVLIAKYGQNQQEVFKAKIQEIVKDLAEKVANGEMTQEEADRQYDIRAEPWIKSMQVWSTQ